jgi:thioredoxin 1
VCLHMATINISDSDFEDKVLKSKLPVLVDFWATWCGPCKMAEPILEELSEEYKDKVLIAKIDVDQNNASSGKYGIMSIPTTVLFKDGKEIGRQIGFSGKNVYNDLVKKAL